MTFTPAPPTKPGFYAWKLREGDVPRLCWVTPGDDNSVWRDGLYPATNGLWCRLVPAEEVEKAFREGWLEGADCALGEVEMPATSEFNFDYGLSRARRVAEGEE